MSALRLPQHLAEPAHVDSGEAHLRFELLESIDGALGHTERDVETALRTLREFDFNERDAVDRQAVLDAAVDAVWRLIVQHEACDCADHHVLVDRYRIPAEVMARIGAAH